MKIRPFKHTVSQEVVDSVANQVEEGTTMDPSKIQRAGKSNALVVIRGDLKSMEYVTTVAYESATYGNYFLDPVDLFFHQAIENFDAAARV